MAECGLDHDKFWELSWYEWSLYARRFKILVHTLKIQDDANWARCRAMWVPFMNANFKKDGGGLFTGDELIKLDHDTPTPSPIEPDLEAIKKMYS